MTYDANTFSFFDFKRYDLQGCKFAVKASPAKRKRLLDPVTGMDKDAVGFGQVFDRDGDVIHAMPVA